MRRGPWDLGEAAGVLTGLRPYITLCVAGVSRARGGVYAEICRKRERENYAERGGNSFLHMLREGVIPALLWHACCVAVKCRDISLVHIAPGWFMVILQSKMLRRLLLAVCLYAEVLKPNPEV